MEGKRRKEKYFLAILGLLLLVLFITNYCNSDKIIDSASNLSGGTGQLSKSGCEYTCYGYAVKKAGGSAGKIIMTIPPKQFETCSINSNPKPSIIEFTGKHAAYITTVYSDGKIRIKEYRVALGCVTRQLTLNPPRYHHPDGFGDLKDFWRKKIPPPPPIPSAPSNLSISGNPGTMGSGDHPRLNWSSSANATGYKIYKSSNGSNYSLIANTGTQTSWTDTNERLESSRYSVQKYYRVKAFNSSGTSGYSNTASCWVYEPPR